MMYLNEVQITNTHAANLIEEGKLEQAHHLLQEGVESLSDCVLAPAPIEHVCSSQENGKLSTDDADAEEEEQDLIMREGEQDDQEVDDEGEPIVPIEVYSLEEEHAGVDTCATDFYSYPFAFEYPTNLLDQPDSLLSDYQYNATAITFLYNQGLCYHLAWKKCPTSTHLLSKAARFYQEAISFLHVDHYQFQPEGSVVKVVFAICVNAAHCHSELAQFSMAHFYNQWIEKLNQQSLLHEEEVWDDAAEFLSLRRHLVNRLAPIASPAA